VVLSKREGLSIEKCERVGRPPMINANKDKLQSFFQGNSQFVVPFFQRAYVWDEENWATMWEHISAVCESCAGKVSKEHFIGTIITKQRPASVIGEAKHDLIDGQQRLTTVALLLKAISSSTSDQMSNLKRQIEADVRFQDAHGKSYSRIVPSDYDRPYFEEILDGSDPTADHKVVRAYTFFLNKLNGYSDEKLNFLRLVILNNVPVISMMLSPDDDEQEIFDTINALGVRLTTGELLKNHIFMDVAIRSRFVDLWKDVYEGSDEQIEFWNVEKTAGRIIRTNIEVMLYCYLIIKTGREIQLESLFKEYKAWLTGKSVEDKTTFLKELGEYAEIYSSYPREPDLNQIQFREDEKRFFHVIENLMVTTIYPLVLYIYKNVENQQVRTDILKILESYLVRRNVCRLTTKNYNLLFIQTLKEIRDRKAQLTPQVLTEILKKYTDLTNRMPADSDFVNAFKQEALSNQNAREILFILALYDVSSDKADVPNLSIGNYSVEHLMPVKWETNWMDEQMNIEAKGERNRKLRTLGNLTLVTKRLNSAMQNAAWSNKKLQLKPNSSLKMTIEYLDKEKWNEACIDERARHLATCALLIWKDISHD
jgi:uncharacterized protein with ParB-like and HNH nuclease domain